MCKIVCKKSGQKKRANTVRPYDDWFRECYTEPKQCRRVKKRIQNNADGSKNGFKTMPTGQKNGTKTMPAGDYTNPKQCRWVKKTNPKQCRRVKKTEPKQCRRANTRIQCNAVGANCVRPISTEWCAIALKFTLQFLQHPTQFFLSFLQTRNQMLGCF